MFCMTLQKHGRINDTMHIPYTTIENPPHGIQYIVDDHIKMEIIVTEKYTIIIHLRQ